MYTAAYCGISVRERRRRRANKRQGESNRGDARTGSSRLIAGFTKSGWFRAAQNLVFDLIKERATSLSPCAHAGMPSQRPLTSLQNKSVAVGERRGRHHYGTGLIATTGSAWAGTAEARVLYQWLRQRSRNQPMSALTFSGAPPFARPLKRSVRPSADANRARPFPCRLPSSAAV
jgi:hypothetical protein